jgi:CHAT domain-containing protein
VTRHLTALVIAAIAPAATFAAPAAGLTGECRVPFAIPATIAVVPESTPSGSAADSILEAQRLAGQGRLGEARTILAPALQAGAATPQRQALGWSIVALAAAVEGDPQAASAAVAQSRRSLPGDGDAALSAVTHLQLGWALTELGDVPETRRAFDEAAAQGARAASPGLVALARVHRSLLEGRIEAAELDAHVRAALTAVERVADAAERARLRVALGLALVPERRRSRFGPHDALAQSVLATAYADASAARDPRSLSQSLGLMGELQLLRGDSGAAATLARAAEAARAQADDPWRFRWSWKRGVALRAAGDSAGALASLREGVDLVEAAKARASIDRFAASSLARGYRRAYLDYADALLAQGDSPEVLTRARDTMELSRASEIADFFRDPCLAERSARVAEPHRLDPAAALLHPLVFDDRIEVLVSHRSGLARFTTRVDLVSVAREVQRLRVAAEHPGSDRYRPMAEQLHAWLVAPMSTHLERLGVKTLVWVPDGALRGLPFAALHDGRTHLVERFAIAVTPVATLTDPRVLGEAGLRANLWGLTVASQGFPALPGVGGELDRLSSLLGVSAARDEAFSVAALQDSLRRSPVNTLHVASHGQFAPEAGQTFLLAYDGRFTLPQLRAALAAGKIREEPVELIVLSACQTAAGDERAALGIAGVAIGAGARSAVATLWSVSDASTATLVERFYRELAARKGNRAESLRQAQLALLSDPATAHPFYWAPFLVIGNWM